MYTMAYIAWLHIISSLIIGFQADRQSTVWWERLFMSTEQERIKCSSAGYF